MEVAGLWHTDCNCGVGIFLQALWCMIFGFVVGLGLMSVVSSDVLGHLHPEYSQP